MNEDNRQSESVGIAMMKYRTIITIVLILGGILTLLVGTLILLFGSNANDSAIIEMLGVRIDAKGFGAVVLASSLLWGFFAYRSRPTYGMASRIATVVDKNGIEHEIVEQEIYDCSVEQCSIDDDSEKSKAVKHIEKNIEKIVSSKKV